MAHHIIFREELAIAYPRYGLALWEPGPGGLYDAVEVGDVGFTRDGYFQRLFNVLHPRDHPSHRNPSLVPEDHEQLQAIPWHIRKDNPSSHPFLPTYTSCPASHSMTRGTTQRIPYPAPATRSLRPKLNLVRGRPYSHSPHCRLSNSRNPLCCLFSFLPL